MCDGCHIRTVTTDKQTVTTDKFGFETKLPIAFRGYACDATDALLHKVEESYRTLLAERNELRSRNVVMQQELQQHRERKDALVDALVKAEQLRATAQRDAKRVLDEAEARAQDLLGHVEKRLEERRHETETLLDDAMGGLRSLVRDLFARVGETSHRASQVSLSNGDRRSPALPPIAAPPPSPAVDGTQSAHAAVDRR